MPKMHIQNLFPTPLMRVEGLLDNEHIEALIIEIKASKSAKNARSESLSHSEVLKPTENSQFLDLESKATGFVEEFGCLMFGEKLNWSIKEIWSNILLNGGHQTIHSHANSFISGIIYLTDSHSSAKTVFHKQLGGTEFVFSNTHQDTVNTPYNSDRWIASDIKRGDLLLYPSYLLHAVPTNEGQERITVAFNAIPDKIKSWDYQISFGS